MKSSNRARSQSVEIDGRMRAFPWSRDCIEALFRIAPPGIQKSQPKMLRALRRHRLADSQLHRLLVEIARWCRGSQERSILIFLVEWFDWDRAANLALLRRCDRNGFSDRFDRNRFPDL